MSPPSTRWLTTTSSGSPASIVASRLYRTASSRSRQRDGSIARSGSVVPGTASDAVSLVMPPASLPWRRRSRDQRPRRRGPTSLPARRDRGQRGGDDEEARTTKALILYESLFGNTAAIARSVAAGLRDAVPDAVVDCRSGTEANGVPEDVDLVVVGAPTHFWGLPRGVTRAMELQYEKRFMPEVQAEVRRATTTAAGIRGGLGPLPPGRGRAAAAFDTQMTGPLTGGACRAIAARLLRAGYRLVAEPRTFLVEAVAGPLRAGETDRARAWGLTLARAFDTDISSNWRQTMERTKEQSIDAFDPALDAPPDPTTPSRPSVDITRVLTTAEV